MNWQPTGGRFNLRGRWVQHTSSLCSGHCLHPNQRNQQRGSRVPRRITKAEVAAVRQRLQTAQGNKCAICSVSFSEKEVKAGKVKAKYRPCLDHDHTTGYIRGVLCNACNRFEGQVTQRAHSVKRNGSVLKVIVELVKYLYKHRKDQTGLIHPDHLTSDEKRVERNRLERVRRAKLKAARK